MATGGSPEHEPKFDKIFWGIPKKISFNFRKIMVSDKRIHKAF